MRGQPRVYRDVKSGFCAVGHGDGEMNARRMHGCASQSARASKTRTKLLNLKPATQTKRHYDM